MRIMKKALGILLSLIMVSSILGSAPVSFRAEEAAPVIKDSFTMKTIDGTDPGTLDYYYSDSYFSTSGKELNPHLRTMSAVLAFTTKGTSSAPEETYGKILTTIGFTDVVTYDMDHTSMDSIGVVLARKTIGEKEVIAVSIRGDSYGVEMAANLIAGAEGDIQAFADAETLVEARVRAYLDTYGITAAKYWVVGYSRSGATANLFGRELNKDLSGFRTTADDIYVYTIDAALSSGDDAVYENIHNVIDRRDIVTAVYPASWPVYNNGTPDYIGGTDDMITLKVLSIFSENYMEDAFQIKKTDFVSDLVGFLSTNISRAIYCEKLQTPVSQIVEIYFNLTSEQQTGVINYFTAVADSLKNDSTMAVTLMTAVATPTSEESVQAVVDLLIKHMDLVAQELGKPIPDADYETVKAALYPIVEVLLPLVYQDVSAEYNPGDGTEPQTAPLYHILTFAGNLTELFKHHFNYNIFNELTAMDSHYRKKSQAILGDADGDGTVTILDATAIQRYLVELEVPVFIEAAANADGDDSLTILDATAIQRYLASLSTNQNIGTIIEY